MKDIEFPIYKTKTEVLSAFNLSDPKERRKYFEFKAGAEIKQIKEYLEHNTFIAYLLGKKNSGKGTYSKLFIDIFGSDKVAHLSIGDMIRKVHKDFEQPDKRQEIMNFLEQNYRGYVSLEDAVKSLINRDTKSLLPTELILALIKREIGQIGKKALFIDGFPRDLDQISYSLFFRDLIDHRKDPDIFVLIDVPKAVIEERIKYRVICPRCQMSRNLKVFPTEKVGYNKEQNTFYLICDDPDCQGERMVGKEGDSLGTASIKERLEKDDKLIKQAFLLYGIPKVFLRNTVPVKLADEYIDDYERTPAYGYKNNEASKKVDIIEEPWTIPDDQDVPSYSLLAPPVVVSLIKQIAKIFCS